MANGADFWALARWVREAHAAATHSTHPIGMIRFPLDCAADLIREVEKAEAEQLGWQPADDPAVLDDVYGPKVDEFDTAGPF